MANGGLIIIGAGVYSTVAKEIAEDMACFSEIVFVDDRRSETPDGSKVVCTVNDLKALSKNYRNVVVAIGNAKSKLAILERIKQETDLNIVSLISPKAHVSKSAKVMPGCVIEPMAVVNPLCSLGEGCIISAGAVVNHMCVCGDGVHVDCNATVSGCSHVPSMLKIESGDVYK